MSPDEAAAALVEAVEALAAARHELMLVTEAELKARYRILEMALASGQESVASADRKAEYAIADQHLLKRKKAVLVEIAVDKVAMLQTLAGRRVDY